MPLCSASLAKHHERGGCWGQKVGRPKVYAGLADLVFQKCEAHLNRLQKHRRNKSDKRLFADIGKLAIPKYDKLKPHLKFLLELAEDDAYWDFGGPFQVSLHMKWNKPSSFHDRNGSREWARSEVGNLWETECALDTLAGRGEVPNSADVVPMAPAISSGVALRG